MSAESSSGTVDKFVETYDVDEYEVMTDSGWVDVVQAHVTRPFEVWVVTTESHSLRCADEHVLFRGDMSEAFVMDLVVDDAVMTDDGPEAILSIERTGEEVPMYDLGLAEGSDHRYYTDGVLSHNSTAYTIFALWLASFNKDKKILICANKQRTSYEFIERIKLAYELMPNWLKPGIDGKWNSGEIKFGNGCTIMGSATSVDTGRSMSCNILIVDEMAFIPPEIMDKFWTSVYPIVSSSSNTKVIVVSTPNGTGNLFYDLWTKATLNIADSEGIGWFPIRIDWHEVPDRDEKWKRQQIESFGGDMTKWNQEYGNQFHGSSFTLIDSAKINECKERVVKAEQAKQEPRLVLVDNYDKFAVRVWEPPKAGRTYVLSGDVSEGVGGDFSIILLFDVTEIDRIRCVASFASNSIPTDEYAYLTNKLHRMYCNALICIECNSIGRAVFDSLQNNYDCDNFLNFGHSSNVGVGIRSHSKVKDFACLWLKNMLNFQEVDVDIREKHVAYEMEFFEKRPGLRGGFSAASGKHDDFMMSFVWAMMALNPQIVESYFVVERNVTTKRGFTLPGLIRSPDAGYYSEGDAGIPGIPAVKRPATPGLPNDEDLMTTLDDDFSTKPRSMRALKKAEDLGPKNGEEDFRKLAFTSADDPTDDWEDSGSW